MFHRWTTQHVIAAGGLLLPDNGIVSCAVEAGFKREDFLQLVRTVRTAVPDPSAFGEETTPEQTRWLVSSDDHLKFLAKNRAWARTCWPGPRRWSRCCCGGSK